VNLSRSGVGIGDDNERVDLEVAEDKSAMCVAVNAEWYSRELAVDVDGV
jgi:tRNA threonylcarbamoyladenosine modification (KEOPS) complex  Pcc1 subunit